MTLRMKCRALALAGVSAASLISAAPALASAPQASAPAADVSTLVSELQGAASRCSSSTDVGALEVCMSNTLATSGFDAVTALAALTQLANNSTPVGQAAEALLALTKPLAQDEIARATSVNGGGTNGASSFGFSGSSNAGGGGYVISQ